MTHGLRSALAPFPDIVVVEPDFAGGGRLHLLLQDPHLHGPVTDAPEVRRAPHPAPPAPLQVGYSWDTRPELVRRTMARGAAGFLSKALPAETTATALLAIATGRRVAMDADGRTIAAPRPRPEHSATRLTPRESEVLELIGAGLTNEEIASRCFLSINSVKSYIRTAYRKIGVTRRPQAILWSIEQTGATTPTDA